MAISGHWDVAVIGGGPAGLAAATRLRQLGVARVILLEREPEAGGVPRHCGHSPYGFREYHRLLSGRTYARALVRDALAAGVVISTRTSVVSCGTGPTPQLTVTRPSGVDNVTAERVVLATGIRETSRAARFLGGDRAQGILTTGALQSLVYLNGMAPFKRPVVYGTELVAFSSLLTCRHIKARVQAMIEPNPQITTRWFARALPVLMGVRLHLQTQITAIHGTERVEGVTLQHATGSMKDIDCDGVVITGRFTPETAVLRQAGWQIDPGSEGPVVDQFGRCEDPGYFATGNLLRPVETAGWCWQEGINTARAVHADLTRGLPSPDRAIPVTTSGNALRYVMAQRVYPDTNPEGAKLQFRLNRAVRGELIVESGADTIWTSPINSRPERRLTIPLAPLLAAWKSGTELTVSVRESR